MFMDSSSFDSSVSSSDLESGCPPPPNDLRPRRAPASQYALRPRKAPSSSSPLGRFFCDGFDDEQPSHFLDACFRCRRPLAGNRDIFMYRGDLPFCSVECRQEQIEMDEGKEIGRNWKLARRPSPRPVESNGGDSPPKSHKTVVAAM